MNPLPLEISNARLSFASRPVLAGLDLALPAGLLVICGRSGAGKSTLLRVIAGLQALESGTVYLRGQEATVGAAIRMAPARREVAMVFQDLGLWPNLTAVENAALGLAGRRLPSKEKERLAIAALTKCGLGDRLAARPFELSGGERQRIALARAFVSSPSLVLLDEPFASLDLLAKEETAALLRAFAREHLVPVLTSVHDPFDAMSLHPDRVAVLEDGRIIEEVLFAELPAAQPTSRILQVWQKRLHGALRPADLGNVTPPESTAATTAG
jgi:ABC-type sugar transport system ATPase subunit